MRASKLIRQLQRPDTPQTVEARIRQTRALEQAARDRAEKYPVITAENAAEAIEFQEARFKQIMGC